MLQMTTKELASLLQGRLIGSNQPITGISIDSRQCKPTECFFAIKGERVDPHDFADQVDAACMVVEREIKTSVPQIIVKNSFKALGQLAKSWRNRFDIEFIAVTGSCGKTTVKNMIASILIQAAGDESKVLYNYGNLNSGFGMPLTLSRLSEKHQLGVLEMGMSTLGEIDHLSRIAEPKVSLINNIYPCHVETVGSFEGIAQAKSEIFHGLKENGVAILNRDSDFYDYCKGQALPHHLLTFGFSAHADFFTKNIDGNRFVMNTSEGEFDVQLQLLGKHNVKNALAAAAACYAYGISLSDIVKGLEKVEPEKSRLQFHTLENNVCLIDDAYNANPASMCEAIDVLVQQSGEKIAVLGDMKELGPDEVRFHRELGEYLKEKKVTKLYAVGDLMQHAVESFGEYAQHFASNEALLSVLQKNISSNQTILFKASNSMGLQKVVQELLLLELPS